MLNFKKVQEYINTKLEKEYKPCYPQREIWEGLKVSVNGGSFGSCLISIEADNARYTISFAYVGKYEDIDAKISDYVMRNYERITRHYYYEDNQRKMSYTLEIFKGDEKINEFKSDEPRIVKDELLKIYASRDKRGTKTRIKYIPYTNDINITQYFSAERCGLSHDMRYVYKFKGIDY